MVYFAHTIKKSRNKELSFCARPQLLSKAFQTVCKGYETYIECCIIENKQNSLLLFHLPMPFF